MKKLNDLFVIEYGNKLDFNKMRLATAETGGVDFVGRSSRNNGIAGTVAPIEGVVPYTPGAITVALGGSKLLSAFVQSRAFYTAQNVAVLTPRDGIELSFQQKVFLCLCIRHNRFRYSAFGREANRTLRDLVVPDLEDMPRWVDEKAKMVNDIAAPISAVAIPPSINVHAWSGFRLDALFDIRKGRRLIKRERLDGTTPFVGASMKSNGIVSYINAQPMFPGGSISVPYNGNGVGFACYQPLAFAASDDVQVLIPRSESRLQADQAALMFVCVVLRLERYRYSFGRKWHLARMRETTIRLPALADESPDWSTMSAFMQTLAFSRVAFLPIP